MKRIPALITAAAVAGSLLLAAPVAADPVFELQLDGAPAETGGAGEYGQTGTYHLTGCLTPQGDPGYFGQFVSWPSEPGRPDDHAEFPADENGEFTMEVTIPLSEIERNLIVNWYCSSAPIDSPTDPALLWMSPEFTFTIAEAPAELLGLDTSTFGVAGGSGSDGGSITFSRPAIRSQAAADEPAVSMTIDPDALPLVDRMGIDGPHAKALKQKTDQVAKTNNLLAQLINRLFGKKTTPPVSNSDYVSAAFQVAGRVPTSRAMAPFVARLDQGELKVTVVEDIALTKQSAAWWNRR